MEKNDVEERMMLWVRIFEDKVEGIVKNLAEAKKNMS